MLYIWTEVYFCPYGTFTSLSVLAYLYDYMCDKIHTELDVTVYFMSSACFFIFCQHFVMLFCSQSLF